MKIIKTGIIYFLLVFGTGFILGPIRLLLVVPRFGARMAELMEMPIMIAVIIVAARWIVRHYDVPTALSNRLGMGLMALGLLLGAEFSLVLMIRGISLTEYFATRDPISGAVYYLSLGVFAFMPLFVERR